MNARALSLFVLLVMGLSRACVVRAAEESAHHPIDRRFEECANAPGAEDWVSLRRCQSQAIDAWEREIVRLHTRVNRKLPAEARIALDRTQKAYFHFAEAERRFLQAYYSSMEGNVTNVHSNSSLLTLYRNRAEQLDAYLDLLDRTAPDVVQK